MNGLGTLSGIDKSFSPPDRLVAVLPSIGSRLMAWLGQPLRKEVLETGDQAQFSEERSQDTPVERRIALAS